MATWLKTSAWRNLLIHFQGFIYIIFIYYYVACRIKASSLSNNSTAKDLTKIIIKTIKERQPKSVEQLVSMLKGSVDVPEKELFAQIVKLQDEGVLKLEFEESFSSYSLSSSLWYLLTIALGVIAVASVFAIPQNAYPWIYARNILGLIFVFFLPGYAFIRAFFPSTVEDISVKSIEMIEKAALSVALSVAIVSIDGLALYYSPFKLDLNAIAVSIFVIASIFATIGLLRGNKVSQQQKVLDKLALID